MTNSLFIGGGNMFGTDDFRNRMVHSAFNGEETDYWKVLNGVDKTSQYWFVFGLFSLMMAVMPVGIVIFVEGIDVIHNWWPAVIFTIISILCFVRSFIRGKIEKVRVKKKYKLMDYVYTLNPEEKEYLLWYRYNITHTSYPVYVIEQMLSNIDRHSFVNHKLVNEINKIQRTKKDK